MKQKNERRIDRSEVRVEALRKQLEQAALEGGFDLLVIADEMGGIVQSGGEGKAHDPVKLAAFGGHLAEMRNLLELQMDIHDCTEIYFVRRFERLLLCRYFEHVEKRLTLIAIASSTDVEIVLLDRVVDGIQRILDAKDMEFD